MAAQKLILVSGKRKKAIARAVIKAGNGIIKINKKILDIYEPAIWRLKLREPLLIAGDLSQKVDIDVNVQGGGISGQTEAVRLAIAKALIQFSKDKKLEKEFLAYDRHMLIADVRKRETRKPNTAGNARSKVQKSYR